MYFCVRHTETGIGCVCISVLLQIKCTDRVDIPVCPKYPAAAAVCLCIREKETKQVFTVIGELVLEVGYYTVKM